MNTRKYTFISIFSTSSDMAEGEQQITKIVIPKIQRDYAQGREGRTDAVDFDRIRARFLDALYDAINDPGKEITLDFIYGSATDGELTPLDGQQRLTTLFLLHWYAAKKANIASDETWFLRCFSYATRPSARDFCEKLADYCPSFAGIISEEMIDESWFPLEWKKDPTIAAMLVMIDAIHDRFKNVERLWNRLKEGAISFYFRSLEDMNLTDDLYIKMNSRGKPLTPFEHFKAELERKIKEIDPITAREISQKIDRDWSLMLWDYRGDNNITDDEFLRYFKFICDVICYHEGGTTQNRSYDEFDLLDLYFQRTDEHISEHIQTMIKLFDCWCKLPNSVTPSEFLSNYISEVHEPLKIRIDRGGSIDIFRECLNKYSEMRNARTRSFPLNKFILLYAITDYLVNRDAIEEEQFIYRLRIVNNLILNSVDEISDSPDRSNGNRMPSILQQVDRIMLEGIIDTTIDKGFNNNQLKEEIEKMAWLQDHDEKRELLFELEDHDLLYGQIGVVGLDNIDLAPRFEKLFNCNLDKVNCALMAIGFYGQQEQARWRYQLGTGSARNELAWQRLFHRSRNQEGFDETARILLELLKKNESPDNQFLDQIANDYLIQCETDNLFDWRYYYIRYKEFRPDPPTYGKYGNSHFYDSPYITTVMITDTKVSENSYNPFLKIAAPGLISREHYGQRVIFPEVYITCENSHYAIFDKESDTEIKRIPIKQNENGTDTEDRIVLLKRYLEENRLMV